MRLAINSEEAQRAWSRLGLFLGLLGLAGCIWTAALWNQQLISLPRSPDPAHGRIYPRNIHGICVYQTGQERDYLQKVQNCSLGVFVVSVLMSIVGKRKFAG